MSPYKAFILYFLEMLTIDVWYLFKTERDTERERKREREREKERQRE